jgi:hypothetical protein
MITIKNAWKNREYMMFAIVLHPHSQSYTGIYYGDQVYPWDNRVWASSNQDYPYITKLKDGIKQHFPDEPEHQYVWNDDMQHFNEADCQVDLAYYENLARKRIDSFLGSSKKINYN